MRFGKFIDVILRHEGGYNWDPDDSGGETNFGIAKRFFPDEDIKNLTVDRAIEIYYEHYYKPLNLHYIHNDELALHIFDMAVNAGRLTAVKLLQELLKDCESDGVLGPTTCQAVSEAELFVDLIDAYRAKRIEYYYRVSLRGNNNKFLKGWVNRVYSTKIL